MILYSNVLFFEKQGRGGRNACCSDVCQTTRYNEKKTTAVVLRPFFVVGCLCLSPISGFWVHFDEKQGKSILNPNLSQGVIFGKDENPLSLLRSTLKKSFTIEIVEETKTSHHHIDNNNNKKVRNT